MKTIKELDKFYTKLNPEINAYKQALKDVVKLMKEIERKSVDCDNNWEELKSKIQGK